MNAAGSTCSSDWSGCRLISFVQAKPAVSNSFSLFQLILKASPRKLAKWKGMLLLSESHTMHVQNFVWSGKRTQSNELTGKTWESTMTSSWGVLLKFKVFVEIKHNYLRPLKMREGEAQEELQLLLVKWMITK